MAGPRDSDFISHGGRVYIILAWGDILSLSGITPMLKRLPITINGGYQTRDFIYVNDVINVMKKSMGKIQKKNICKNFNLGTGRSVKIDLLFNLIKKITKTKPKVIKKKSPKV